MYNIITAANITIAIKNFKEAVAALQYGAKAMFFYESSLSLAKNEILNEIQRLSPRLFTSFVLAALGKVYSDTDLAVLRCTLEGHATPSMARDCKDKLFTFFKETDTFLPPCFSGEFTEEALERVLYEDMP